MLDSVKGDFLKQKLVVDIFCLSASLYNYVHPESTDVLMVFMCSCSSSFFGSKRFVKKEKEKHLVEN